MVLLLIGVVIGIIVVSVLIIKAFKTPSQEIIGINISCNKCGIETHGSRCPKCENKSQSFDI